MKRLCLFLLYLIAFFPLMAQKATIKGVVTDSKTKESLFGVNVAVTESVGITTDLEGKFSIQVDPARYEVKFTFLGYAELVKDVKVDAGAIVELNVSITEKLEELDIVVVTGSKFGKQVSQEVNSIDVLKPDLIKNTNSVTLAEGINKVSGVTMIDNSVSIRSGSTYSYGVGSRVLLLVDDLPINTVDRGDIRWNNVPLEITDQVEVIKGASSSLYGASALNGVINVRTTYPKTNETSTEASLFFQGYAPPQKHEQKWWGPPNADNIDEPLPIDTVTGLPDSSVALGDPDLPAPQRFGATFAFKKNDGRFDYVVGANFMKERGIIRLNDQQYARLVVKFRHRPVKVDNLSYGMNVNMQDSKESDFFFWKDAHIGAYIPYDSDDYDDDGTVTTYRKQIVTLDPWTIYHDNKDNKHLLRLRYQYQATQFGSNYPDFHLFMAEYQFQREFRRKLRLTAGLMGQVFTVNDETMSSGTHHNGSQTALYGQVDKSFGKLNLVFGARWELYKIDNELGYLTPVLISGKGSNIPLPVANLGLNYQVGRRTYLRANSGMGFRLPSFTERYVDANAGPVNAFSNPDLKPEFGVTGEVGAKQGVQISKWLAYLDLAFFWQEYWELVQYKFSFYGTPLAAGFKALNISRARVAGLEFSFTGEGKIGKIPLRLLGGYTFTYPVELSAEGDTTLNKFGPYMKNLFKSMKGIDDELYTGLLGYRYRHQLKADIEIDVQKFTFGTEFQYYSFMDKIEYVFSIFIPDVTEFRDAQQDRKVSGDIFLNLRAAYDFSKYGKISLIVGNVLNRESAVRIAKMDPPLNFTVQYRIKI